MIKIGDRLKEERKRQGYSVEQVAKATKIRPQFISAIEEGNYKSLPGGNYAHGFVKNYIEFLNLPQREYLAMFRREYNEKEYLDIVPEGLVEKPDISLPTIRFNRTILLVVAAGIGVILYLFFQYRAAFFPPSLVVNVPSQNQKVTAQSILVSGTTDTSATVSVNNLPAYIDSTGHFSKEIPVFPGNVTITVKAVNSFGTTATVERHIVVLVGQ